MKTESKVSKALYDVWEWKDKVYLKFKDQQSDHRKHDKGTDEIIRRLGLKTLSR